MTNKLINKKIEQLTKSLSNAKGLKLTALLGRRDAYLELQELETINFDSVEQIKQRSANYLNNKYLSSKDKVILQATINEFEKVQKTLKK